MAPRKFQPGTHKQRYGLGDRRAGRGCPGCLWRGPQSRSRRPCRDKQFQGRYRGRAAAQHPAADRWWRRSSGFGTFQFPLPTLSLQRRLWRSPRDQPLQSVSVGSFAPPVFCPQHHANNFARCLSRRHDLPTPCSVVQLLAECNALQLCVRGKCQLGYGSGKNITQMKVRRGRGSQ